MQTQPGSRPARDNPAVGIAFWLAAGLVAFVLSRVISLGRDPRWKSELAVAAVTALLLGVLATALDFGGWQELEWRAGLFAFLGAAAAGGALRLVRS
jgi:hypothetical protein